MVQIRVDPVGIILEIEEGETVMEAAHRAGYWWPTICHGDAECGICMVEVLQGADSLEAAGDEERSGLETCTGRLRHGGVARLACRLTVAADVVIWKRGVRPARADEL